MPDGPAFRRAKVGAWSSRSRAIPQPKQGFMTMALYEHLLIARQDISAQQVDALATHLKTILEGEEGKVEKQEYWGLRGLAYRIKKNRKGHYVLLNINAPAKAVQELERQLKINEDVLRFITVKVDQFEQSSNKNKREREENKTENADAAGTKAETAGTKEAAQ
jgi:small subunit ribosomal protein S6